MPDNPAETTDQTNGDAPLVAPDKQMPSMVAETITEGLEPDRFEIRDTQLK